MSQPFCKILLKRGTKAQNDVYIGEAGEITIVVPDPIETTTLSTDLDLTPETPQED